MYLVESFDGFWEAVEPIPEYHEGRRLGQCEEKFGGSYVGFCEKHKLGEEEGYEDSSGEEA